MGWEFRYVHIPNLITMKPTPRILLGQKLFWTEKRDWHRRFILTTIINGERKTIRLQKEKRPYPSDNCCEVCGKQSRLCYHHWNDKKLHVGVWLCTKCHHLAELIDETYFENHQQKYEQLKEYLERLGEF